jgi:hypothetical protein
MLNHGGVRFRCRLGVSFSCRLTQYLRALVTDVADALGVPDPSGGAGRAAATHRPRTLREPVLRNL